MISKPIYCYRSGPIERDPNGSFHARNRLDDFLRKVGIEIIGDSFKYLDSINEPQIVYGKKMKLLRDQGRFRDFSIEERLLKISLRSVRRADFMVIRPASEASGGTTSEITMAWLNDIPRLTISGPYGENILDNDSTLVIRMLSDRSGLVFRTEKGVTDFINKNLEIFKRGRSAIRKLIWRIKNANHFINDQPKNLWSDDFFGKTLILLGLPGCGKDTQGRLLQERCGFKFFGSGIELRRLSEKFPVLKKSLEKGNLAPEIILNYLMTWKLLKLDEWESVVFAGVPKKIGEAKGLMELLKLFGRKARIIVIDISEELARKRIFSRRICNFCEISYCDDKFIIDPICPECLGPLSSRAENINKEAIETIMRWYETEVRPTIDFFETNENSRVDWIDGSGSIEEIHDKILSLIRS